MLIKTGLLLTIPWQLPENTWKGTGFHGEFQSLKILISTVFNSIAPEASESGAEILKEGGNAIDAAVAVSLALGVAEPAGSGIGGRSAFIIQAPNPARGRNQKGLPPWWGHSNFPPFYARI